MNIIGRIGNLDCRVLLWWEGIAYLVVFGVRVACERVNMDAGERVVQRHGIVLVGQRLCGDVPGQGGRDSILSKGAASPAGEGVVRRHIGVPVGLVLGSYTLVTDC